MHRWLRAAKARRVDLSDLRARKVTAADFATFDDVLAMDGGRLTQPRRMAPPGSAATVALFLGYAPGAAKREVPDPYSGKGLHFTEVLDLCEAGAKGLLEAIRRDRL